MLHDRCPQLFARAHALKIDLYGILHQFLLSGAQRRTDAPPGKCSKATAVDWRN
jgi:hypothetical protein